MNRDELERPFDQSLIKTRPGSHGQQLSYIEVVHYVRKMQEAFDGHWSVEALEHHILDNEVIVLVKVSADGVVKTAFGGSSITTNRQTGAPVSIGDDLKSAMSSAIRKAVSYFGVGLDLYSSTQPQPGPQQHRPQQSRQPQHGNGRQQLNGDRITQRQLTAIYSMGRNLGMTSDEIRSRSVEAFQAQPEQLTRSEASSIISELQADLDGRPIN